MTREFGLSGWRWEFQFMMKKLNRNSWILFDISWRDNVKSRVFSEKIQCL